MPGLVVGVAQAAQLRHRQSILKAHCRQLGPRRGSLARQRMRQQQLLVERLRLPRLPHRIRHQPLRQLVGRAGVIFRMRRQHLLRRRRVVQRQQHAGLNLRNLRIKDRVRVAVRKSMQQRFGRLLVARLVVRLRAQKIVVVG